MPDSLPVNENAPFKKAESPYGETKQECEILINKSLYFEKILALVIGVVFDHLAKACNEFSTAIFTISLLANSTSAICSPVAGLNTLPFLEFLFEYNLPLIK